MCSTTSSVSGSDACESGRRSTLRGFRGKKTCLEAVVFALFSEVPSADMRAHILDAAICSGVP